MSIQRPLSSYAIPPEAKKVFVGAIFDVYQWQQELYDGSFATFEKLKRPDTAVVIAVTENQEVLLIEEQQPGTGLHLDVPAGRLEEGEDPEQGALRELLEETGYEAGDISLWKAEQPVTKIDWAVYLFIARKCRLGGSQKLDAGERISLRSVSFETFLENIRSGTINNPDLLIEVLRADVSPAAMAALRKRILG